MNGRNISEIVILGVITNNSVEATARMSGNLGFRTLIISDETFTFNKADFAGKVRFFDQEVYDLSLANLSGEYAEIFNTSEVLKHLQVPKTPSPLLDGFNNPSLRVVVASL